MENQTNSDRRGSRGAVGSIFKGVGCEYFTAWSSTVNTKDIYRVTENGCFTPLGFAFIMFIFLSECQ